MFRISLTLGMLLLLFGCKKSYIDENQIIAIDLKNAFESVKNKSDVEFLNI